MTSVYISNGSIQAVIGTGKGKRVKVSGIHIGELDSGCIFGGVITDEAALREALSSFWKANKLPKSGIHLVLESSSVSAKLLTLPNLRSNLLMGLVKESFSEFEAEDAVYDYATLGPGEDGGISVLGCMTEAAFIQSYVSLFRSAGLQLSSIGLAVCGQIRMTAACSELNNSSFILAALDSNVVSQFMFIEGEYRFSKRQRLFSERETPEFAEEIARMISSLIQFKKSENISADISDVYLCGATEQEINSVSLMYGDMRIGRLPELSAVTCPEKYRNLLSDSVLAVGGLF